MTDNDPILRGLVLERLNLAEHDAEERDWRSGANELARIRKYVEALPAVTVGVKPLVWFELERGQNGYGKWTAEGYTVRKIEGLFLLDFAGDSKSVWRFPTAAAAKAAAQADYTARILAALEPAVDASQTADPAVNAPDPAAIREAALLEVLHLIGGLPTPKNEDIMQGHEEAYRAVEARLALIAKGASE